jgi:hypothetical protein
MPVFLRTAATKSARAHHHITRHTAAVIVERNGALREDFERHLKRFVKGLAPHNEAPQSCVYHQIRVKQ